ncbi:MAG: hypothetical protein PHY47_12755 [Lachnospiraceae bacterium]|nr:hypothetical protein [Lachnospiraceae bacterium]
MREKIMLRKAVKYNMKYSSFLIYNNIYYTSYILKTHTGEYYGFDLNDKHNKFCNYNGETFNEHYYQFGTCKFDEMPYSDNELVINIIKEQGVI